ncbi:hypothetical protein HID58_067085 [Brassica napus]|uniref:Uncharacterized protein n=1 Tax=Brassica napus TaxID=3708 RepID=A0ABQ7ZHJ5_BRANA|nr:hypothetical protein HID58_067085 [Brassica napus]
MIMALFPEPGSWRGFLEQVSGTGTQFGNDETQPPSPQPPSPEIEMDDVPEVKVTKNGRRFGYGTMDIGEPSGPSYATQSPDYKALYLETQTKLVQVTNKCDELSSQVEDAQYWSTVMRNMFPDHVPPSQAARQAATANNTFEA